MKPEWKFSLKSSREVKQPVRSLTSALCIRETANITSAVSNQRGVKAGKQLRSPTGGHSQTPEDCVAIHGRVCFDMPQWAKLYYYYYCYYYYFIAEAMCYFGWLMTIAWKKNKTE